jgi:hypothetical protein
MSTTCPHCRASLPGPNAQCEACAIRAERCRPFGGELVVLWHNHYLANVREAELYRSVVEGALPPGDQPSRALRSSSRLAGPGRCAV